MPRIRTPQTLLVAFALAAAGAAAAPAAEWTIDPERSVFAVLTHKAGIGARLAHDHLIVAGASGARLDFDPERPEATRFTLAARAAELEVDPPAARARWAPRLAELGALAAPTLAKIDEKDRGKVRAAMLGAGQLDGGRHPELAAELVAVAPGGAAGAGSGPGSAWTARLRLTVRGRAVELEAPLTWRLDDGVLTAEALGATSFRKLGIEPYSTLLGAIKNDDRLHLFVVLVARPPAAAAAP